MVKYHLRLVRRQRSGRGEMSEWFKEPVLKTGDSQEPWVRIPLSPPFFPLGKCLRIVYMPGRKVHILFFVCRSTQVAIRGSPAKGVGG